MKMTIKDLMTEINITETQKRIIIKAVENIKTLYDFDNQTNKEFKECYGIDKSKLLDESVNLINEVFIK
jgi:hypothetical protein